MFTYENTEKHDLELFKSCFVPINRDGIIIVTGAGGPLNSHLPEGRHSR